MMQIISLLSGILSAAISLYKIIKGYITKTPQEKMKEIIADTDKAIEKAKKTGDTSGLENLLNK